MFQRLAAGLVVVDDLLEALAGGILALRLDRNRRTIEIIEKGIHPILEQRQPMLHARMTATFTDSLVQGIVTSRRTERRHIAHAKTADRLRNELEFRNRDQIERAHIQVRALGFRLERTNGFQAVAKE